MNLELRLYVETSENYTNVYCAEIINKLNDGTTYTFLKFGSCSKSFTTKWADEQKIRYNL